MFLRTFKKLITLALLALCMVSCGNPDDLMRPGSAYWLAPMSYDDTGSTLSLNVASVCLSVDAEPVANQAKMVAFIDTIVAEHPEVNLILFGKTSLGYYYRPSSAQAYQIQVAETIPGPTTALLAAEALSHQIHISFGLSETKDQLLYNSQVLLDPQGQIVSVHRKIHLTDWDIDDGFTAGDTVTFDMIDGIKTATIICYDSMSADINKRIYDAGAQLVLLPMADTVDETFIHFSTNVFDNLAWLVAANRVGNEDGNTYDGHIFIAAPNGQIRGKSSKQEAYIYGKVAIK